MMTADDLTLITDPEHKLLHTPTAVVVDFEETRKYIPAMMALLRRTRGVGLSANQVGVSESVFVTNLKGDWPKVFINPSIEMVGRLSNKDEGCLSYPLVTYKRKRHSRVIARAFDMNGEPFLLDTARGYYQYRPLLGILMAQVIQHESEHLDGIDVRTGELLNYPAEGSLKDS